MVFVSVFRVFTLLFLASCLFVSVAYGQSASVDYEYDELGRLKKSTYDTGEVETVTYDAAGNRTDYDVTGVPTSTTAYSIDDVSEEEGDNIVFTVSRTGTAVGVETIDYDSASGTATQGTDYTGVSDTLTFQTTDTSKTITVSTTEDSSDESDETFTVTLSNLQGGASIADSSGTGTIENDDTPTSSTAYSIDDVSEEEGDNIVFTVSRTGTAVATETIDYASASGTATQGTDYTGVNDSLTFLTTDTSKTITVSTTEETAFESDETFTVTLSNLQGGSSIADSSGTGTIENDDSSTSTTAYGVDDYSTREGLQAIFTVSRTGTAPGVETIDYATSSGTATQGTDFTSTSGTLTFQTSDTSKTVYVPSIQDTALESDETFSITLSNLVGGSSIADATGQGTITDEEPEISVSQAGVGYDQEGDTYTFTVNLTNGQWHSGQSYNVDYDLIAGTAQAGSDYTDVSGTLTLSYPGNTSKTVNVSLTEDTVYEADETLTFEISNPTNNSYITGASRVLTIKDDDTAPQFSIDDVTEEEGTGITFTVTKTGSTSLTHGVSYATTDVTATAGSDYTAASGSLSFGTSETTKTFTVSTTDDSTAESSEQFNTNLSSPTNGATVVAGTNGVGTGTITDNDSGGGGRNFVVYSAVSPTSVAENGAIATYYVILDDFTGLSINDTFTVDYDIVAVSATQGSDYTATAYSGTLTIIYGSAHTAGFYVSIVDDSAAESTETYRIDLSNPTGGAGIASGSTSWTVGITDND